MVQIINDLILDDSSEEILDIIAYTREYADEMRGTLGTAVENLSAIVSTYDPGIDDIDSTIPSIDGPSFPPRPSFLPLELDNSWPSGYVPEPVFQEFGLLDFDFVTPTLPEEVSSNLNFVQKNYTSEMWQTLFSEVHGRVLNGSYGITDAVHSAMVSQEQEARRRNQNRSFREGLAAVGASGFNLPGGHQAAFMSEFGAEVLFADQSALNNITIKCFEIANENQKFYATAAIDLEKILRATFDEAEKISLEAAKAASDYLSRFYAENIKLYLAKWDGIRFKMESLKIKVDSIVSKNDNETKIFIARAQLIESRVKAVSEKNQNIIDVRTGEIQIYSTEISAVKEEYVALIEEVKVHQEAIKMEIEQAVAIEQMKLSAFESKTKLAEAVAMGVANIASQGVASALGAINTQLTNTYSGSEQKQQRQTQLIQLTAEDIAP